MWVIVILVVAIFSIALMYMVKQSSESKSRLSAINSSISEIGETSTSPKSSGLFKTLSNIIPVIFGV